MVVGREEGNKYICIYIVTYIYIYMEGLRLRVTRDYGNMLYMDYIPTFPNNNQEAEGFLGADTLVAQISLPVRLISTSLT